MILALSIRDFVLIDRLDIEPGAGFTALTGETGAGKSIILDALSLTLGSPADRAMIRAGAEQASVAAEFAVPPGHPVWAVLAEHGLEASPDETLTPKRVVRASGPARAFVNDQPVSARPAGGGARRWSRSMASMRPRACSGRPRTGNCSTCLPAMKPCWMPVRRRMPRVSKPAKRANGWRRRPRRRCASANGSPPPSRNSSAWPPRRGRQPNWPIRAPG
ncbi:MAG: AAA family ATPase [Hyphomonas sp.]